MSTADISFAPNPRNEPRESDVLVPFEIQNIPEKYREYYRVKRNNFFASIQQFPEMWKYYVLLDEIWLREFDDLNHLNEARAFPLILYINAHAKIRISIELGFSGCMAEARSILRDAVESVAHAHTILSDVELQKTWLSKNDDKAALEAFKDAFLRSKGDRLFKGLDALHNSFGELSETGSHATLNALCDRFRTVESENHMEFRLNYCGVEPRMWVISLFDMLLICFTMEQTMFRDYENRLKLDDGLLRMRSEFERRKEQLRKDLIIRYEIKLPTPSSAIHKP